MTSVPSKYSREDRKALDVINKSPALLSFLYDLDLLPEQLEPGTADWKRMALVVSGFIIGQQSMRKETAMADVLQKPSLKDYTED